MAIVLRLKLKLGRALLQHGLHSRGAGLAAAGDNGAGSRYSCSSQKVKQDRRKGLQRGLEKFRVESH